MDEDFNDLRCPDGPNKLLGRATPDGLIELYCKACSKDAKQANTQIRHVLHRFLDNEPYETIVAWADGSIQVFED